MTWRVMAFNPGTLKVRLADDHDRERTLPLGSLLDQLNREGGLERLPSAVSRGAANTWHGQRNESRFDHYDET